MSKRKPPIECYKCHIEKPVSSFPAGSTWCRKCTNLRHMHYYQANKAGNYSKFRERAWKSLGIVKDTGLPFSVGDYNYLLVKQDKGCAICKETMLTLNKALHVDHNHTTGKVRGLLCTRCNTALGLFRDDVNRLKTAVSYLENYK